MAAEDKCSVCGDEVAYPGEVHERCRVYGSESSRYVMEAHGPRIAGSGQTGQHGVQVGDRLRIDGFDWIVVVVDRVAERLELQPELELVDEETGEVIELMILPFNDIKQINPGQ